MKPSRLLAAAGWVALVLVLLSWAVPGIAQQGVRILSIAAGDTNFGNVDVVSLPAITGTVTITDGAGAVNVIADSGTITTVSTVTSLSQFAGVAIPLTTTQADNLADSLDSLNVTGFTYVYDGAAWDRWTGAVTVSGVATAANQSTEITSLSTIAGDTTDIEAAIELLNPKFPTTAALADNTANPTLSAIAAYLMVFDGSTWDRAQIATDMTVGTAYGTTAPGQSFLYQDFDGAALATPTNVDTELEAVPASASIKGIQYFMWTTEDGSGAFGTTTTPVVIGDGAGALNVIIDSSATLTVTATNLDVQSNGTDLATSAQGAAIQVAVEILDNAISGAGFNITQLAGATTPMTTTQADDLANTLDGLNVTGFLYGFDGTTWDRVLATAGAVHVTDGAGAMNVIIDSSATLTVTDGAGALNVIVDSSASIAVTNAGTFAVQSVEAAGALLTSSQLIDDIVGVEDVAETAGGGLARMGAVRRDVAASSTATDAENATVNTDALGLMWTRQLDPCSGVAKQFIPIDIVTATTTELTAALAGASTHYYICSINLVTAAANNVALVDDNTDGCGSPTAGVMGGFATAAEGWNFGANGGLTLGGGSGSVRRTTTANAVLCLITSAATQLSGHIVVVAAP